MHPVEQASQSALTGYGEITCALVQCFAMQSAIAVKSGIKIALGCLSLLWRQVDPFKMIPDLCVRRPAKSFTLLCRRLRSIRHGQDLREAADLPQAHSLSQFVCHILSYAGDSLTSRSTRQV